MVKDLHEANGTKMSLSRHKGNFDEWQLDLNRFATSNESFLRRGRE